MLASLKQILAQYFIPFFPFLDRCKSCLDWIWWDLLSTDFPWLDLTNPLFFIFVNLSKNQCSQSSVWQHNLTSPFFFYHCFVYFLKQMFSAFPYFLSFLSVFIGLMFSDIIWPPPFFIILYPIITRSKFSYFLHFLSVFMCLLFSDIIWPLPFFLSDPGPIIVYPCHSLTD